MYSQLFWQDSFVAELYSLLSREPEFSQIFLDYYLLQAEHHRNMLTLLEDWLPQIQSTLSKLNPVLTCGSRVII